MSSQAFGAALGAPTSITQCKPATTTTITLCWTAPSAGANPKVMSYIFLNATETCSGSGADYTCSFGNFQSAYTIAGTGGLNATTGTGSAVTIANFTGLSAGNMFQFKVMAFNAHGNGTLSSAFQAGTLLGASVDYSERPTQSFGNGTTFGASTEFAPDQDFANFQNFGVGQIFGSGTGFAEDQTFNGTQNFSEGSIVFDANTQFDTVQSFGNDANFTGQTLFTGANTFGTDAKFGDGANFPAGQTFGKGAEFTGNAVFGSTQTFPIDAIFAEGQSFTADSTYTFDDFAAFKTGTDFGSSRTFDVGTMFDSVMTFYEGSAFSESAMFGDGQSFSAAMTFGEDMHFGANTDFTALAQTFKAGTTFDPGTTFAVGQVMPLDAVPSYGLMLSPFTCVDATCVPPAGNILSPGEYLSPGTDPAEITSSVSLTSPDVSIPGLGFIMNFTSVSANGKTSVDPIDPALLTNQGNPAGLGSTAGSVSVGVPGAMYDTMGMALDISAGTATVSGDIAITMPYDENTLGSVNEADLVVLHYNTASEAWSEVSNCTIDTDADNIRCTGITSLSPFSLGSSTTPGTGGGSCNTNGYGSGKSLALYEINWDILEANEVVVIAGSTCGPIELRVFTQHSIVSGGLAPEQPYLAENKVILHAPLNISASDSFRITLDNDWNSYEQTIYPELQGSSGTILLNFQEVHYDVKFLDDGLEVAAVPSSEGFMDPEPQLIMEPEPYSRAIMDPEPEPVLSFVCGEGTVLIEGVCEVQERQMSFLDWLFSLFS